MADFFELFFSKDFEEKFNQELDKILSERDGSTEETISDITEHYLQIIRSITSGYQRIIIDKTDFRQIKIDHKSYDLDALISHNQAALSEHLSAIDALFSDLATEDADLEKCIFEIESKLNSK
ncbi:MAG: hypothetical protein IK954_05065 [Clostridia bacterium]|nr:hypothetical protein [Clostridia bacterium]